MILDTCFIIDLLGGEPRAQAKLEELADRHLRVPTITYTEVAIGLEPGTESAARFDAVMDQIPIVPYDAEAARRTVDVQRSLYEEGSPIGIVDAMIAGIALTSDAPIVTRNVEEFRRTPVRISPY